MKYVFLALILLGLALADKIPMRITSLRETMKKFD